MICFDIPTLMDLSHFHFWEYFSIVSKKMIFPEFYQNLSYINFSDARDFDCTAISDLIAKISFLLKSATRSNIAEMENADVQNAYNINKNVSFVPKQEDPLDVVIYILDENIEHKKITDPYVPPQVETETRQINDEFAKLKPEYDRVNNAAAEQKKQDELTDLVDDIIDESNSFQKLSTEDM